MRIFITGASGWIGSAVTDELLAAGHEITGLARSDSSAATLEAKGVRVLRGDLDDFTSLRAGTDEADAVIHLANKHDFDNPAISNAAERAAVGALGKALAGSGRTLLVASGMPGAPGRPGREDDPSPFHGPDAPRGGSENLALEFVTKGVRVVIPRFAPTVHGAGDHGFIASLVAIARERGVSGYVDDGSNRWPAVHVSDAARLVALGLDADSGTVLHAVGEEGVPTREIAEAIGRGLGVPAQSIAADAAATHFGWIGAFFGRDLPATSAATQQVLGWSPTGPTLADDLASGAYFR